MSKAPAKAAKPAEGAEEAPVKKSKKKLIIIIAAAVILLSAIGGGAFFFLSKKGGSKKEAEHKEEPAAATKAPVFLPLDPFTVNLQSSEGDKFLQVNMTLQVRNEEQVNIIKLNMPQVRSRLLMLISSKDASSLLSSEGKEQLVTEIVEQVTLPFVPKGDPQKVEGVFFTSFIVQ